MREANRVVDDDVFLNDDALSFIMKSSSLFDERRLCFSRGRPLFEPTFDFRCARGEDGQKL